MTDAPEVEDRKHSVFFGAELVARRKELGLTRAQAAEKAGLSYGVVGKLEKNERVKPVEYRALVTALGLSTDDELAEVPVADGESWGGLHPGDPVILADRPDVEYEYRRYNPPGAKGGEYVEVGEREGKHIRQIRPVFPWLVCRYTGVGVDLSEEAEAQRQQICDRVEAQKLRAREAAQLKKQHLNEVDV